MKKGFILGLSLLAACAANAMPTLSGPTGGLELPTAYVANSHVTVAVDQATDQNGISWPNTRLLFSFCNGLEIGGKYQQLKADEGSCPIVANLWNVNAKYQLPFDTGSTKIAIGGLYGQVGYFQDLEELLPPNNDHQWAAYLAVTTPVWGLRATGDIGYGEDFAIDRSGVNGGFALEAPMGNHGAAGAEFIFGDKTGFFGDIAAAQTHGNLYLRRDLSPTFSARVGIGGLGQDTELFLGAAVKFGLCEEGPTTGSATTHPVGD